MKKLVLIFSFLCCSFTYSQPWNYDFGSTSKTQSSTGIYDDFLPQPLSGQARIKNVDNSAFYLESSYPFSPGNVYLKIRAANSSAVSKFSIFNINSGKTFYIKFKTKFGSTTGASVNTGTFQFLIGSGSNYSDIYSSTTSTDHFTGIQFVYGGSSAITTSILSSSGWTVVSPSPVQQSREYTIEVYANNSLDTITYNKDATFQTLPPNRVDIFIDRILKYDNLNKNLISDNTELSAFMFIGYNSTSNAGHMFIDDLEYSNNIPNGLMPVELSSFTSRIFKNNVHLTWTTETEVNNYGFNIERKRNGEEFKKIGFVEGNGNSNSPKRYFYNDNNLSNGLYQYRLKQLDNDGAYEYSDLITSTVTLGPNNFYLTQNYPNPFNPNTIINFFIPDDSQVRLSVNNIIGQEVAILLDEVKTAGEHEFNFNANIFNLPSGTYFYTLKTSSGTLSKKMTLIK